ncbi:MAG: hypothetical protein K0R93_1213 [Anaerosolibacter sp.]|uniref:hypothetical protein n=1 Tax=Anaerosolibacter sp. TaxID=1872527 RepID=UPI00263761AD|nr:hypothetical protein [Anaerosolibacter sp.]MDF2546315.1 hypothetical protein [Anaerosolibacter sp.]
MTKAQSTPRRKRYKKDIRLIHAAQWLQENSPMKNVIKRYAKWFGVSRLCAAQELISLGVIFDKDVVSREKQLEIDKANQRKQAKEKRLQLYNETYYYFGNIADEEDWIEHDEGIPF